MEIRNFRSEMEKLYTEKYKEFCDSQARSIIKENAEYVDNIEDLNLKDLGKGTRISQKSCNGIAVVFDSLVLKTGRNNGEDDVLHEAFMGLNGLNSLNVDIFSMVYGYITIPIFPNEIKINSDKWLSEQECTNAVIYEYIANSVSFSEYSTYCSSKELVSALLQITLSLRYAHRKVNFTHYDLHSNNCLIALSSSNEISIEGIRLKAYNSPKIIDYGTSYMELDGQSFGAPNWSGSRHRVYNIKSYESNPLHDIFKLLTSLYLCANIKNKEILSKYIKFFTSENVQEFVETSSKLGFTYPRSSNLNSFDQIIKRFLEVSSKYGVIIDTKKSKIN